MKLILLFIASTLYAKSDINVIASKVVEGRRVETAGFACVEPKGPHVNHNFFLSVRVFFDGGQMTVLPIQSRPPTVDGCIKEGKAWMKAVFKAGRK